MNKSPLKCFKTAPQFSNRLIFENKPSQVESFSNKEQDNLEGVSEAVKESYLKRLEMMRDIDKKVASITEERKQYLQAIREALADLPKLNGQPARKEFQCLGETIQVVMTPDGEYQEFIQGKPINFLEWAIAKKSNLPSKLNE